ncbi:unnamed protein product, partial [Heterotrigona itama]
FIIATGATTILLFDRNFNTSFEGGGPILFRFLKRPETYININIIFTFNFTRI